MSTGGAAFGSVVTDAIRSGETPPDILGQLTGASQRPEKNGVEWVAFTKSPGIAPGQNTEVVILLQNATDTDAMVSVSLEVAKHPNILSSKVDITQPGTVEIRALEVASLGVPIHVRDNAGQGEYTVKIDLGVRFPGSGQVHRVRPKAEDLKAQRNWASLIAGNVVGIGLAATVGLGFKVIPRSYKGITFSVGKGAAFAGREDPSSAGFRSIWSAADWERSLHVKRSVWDNWQGYKQKLTFKPLFSAILKHVVQKYSALLPAEHVLLALSMSGTMQMLLSDTKFEDSVKDWVVDSISGSDHPASPRFSAGSFVTATGHALLKLSTMLSIDNLNETWALQDDSEKLQFTEGMVSMLESGDISPDHFWMLWGLDGIIHGVQQGPILLVKHKQDILAALKSRFGDTPSAFTACCQRLLDEPESKRPNR